MVPAGQRAGRADARAVRAQAARGPGAAAPGPPALCRALRLARGAARLRRRALRHAGQLAADTTLEPEHRADDGGREHGPNRGSGVAEADVPHGWRGLREAHARRADGQGHPGRVLRREAPGEEPAELQERARLRRRVAVARAGLRVGQAAHRAHAPRRSLRRRGRMPHRRAAAHLSPSVLRPDGARGALPLGARAHPRVQDRRRGQPRVGLRPHVGPGARHRGMEPAERAERE